MKSKILIILFITVIIGSCTQSSTSSDSQATKTQDSTSSNEAVKTVEAESTDSSSIESDIQFIRDKYDLISNAADYKTVPFATECDERSSTKLERKYNKKGELSYLKYEECGGHGCSIKHHYYWEGELIFIFHKNDSTPGNSHIIEEHRTYFKNGEMIQCLEKKAHRHGGQAPMEELLKKANNKEVDCTPEKLTANLSEIESLSIEDAEKYFCLKSNRN